ncbi:histone deacetylase 10 isoform X6 [Sus scrofa]|uniref:histone deacetylase 10 isoform X6 n=1 Tax=Sus scrofa TaxID=9823 RepID=UPI000A2B286B|nr:histone deacetylase 10 isoform X6 [Sus scrofa]
MGTALVYHEDMTAARLLWDDPECEIERPERLTTALERLRQRGLEQRCLRLVAREASEAELGLVHSPEYVALLRGTQALSTEELQALSRQFDAVYFHPSTFHCARLAAGAALQLVDAVMAGVVRNGLALVRPPGHHSQRAAANGFCVFNSVAIAAKHAQQKHGLHRTHASFTSPGTAMSTGASGPTCESLMQTPSAAGGALASRSTCPGTRSGWETQITWPPSCRCCCPWPLSLCLPLLTWPCLQFNAELVLVSAGFDSAIGDSEGGYHLESLSQSVCMMVQALLGDPAPPLSGPMVPHGSALQSIQSVRAAQAPHWMSLRQQGVAPVLSSSTRSPGQGPSPPMPAGPEFKTAAAQAVAALSSLLDQLRLRPTPPVRTALALPAPLDGDLVLPHDVLCQEGSAPQEETQAWARPHEALAQDKALSALGRVLHLLDRILDGQVSSGIAATPGPAVAATLDVAIRCGLSHGAQRLLCVAVGQLDRPPHLTDDGGTLWLNVGGKEAAALSMFHVSVPLPRTTGGFLSCVLALVLPLAYSFQPDLVLVVLGPAHGLQDPQAALLAALLRGPAGGRVLALVDEESTPQLAVVLARVLHGEAPPSLGPFCMASLETMQALMHLRGQLEPQWKMLRVAGETGRPGSA